MKTMHLPAGIAAIVTATILLGGCQKTGEGTEQAPKPAQASAEKNSFQEVTSHLDAGGNFYLYLSTEAWLDGLSARIADWRGFLDSIPNLKDDDRQKVGRAFDVITNLVKTSGVEDISGVGMSSIAMEKGFYHGKSILHHYRGKGSGFLWSALGKSPHALDGLDLLPATTAVATFSDGDLPLLWSTLDTNIQNSGIPEVVEAWKKVPEAFENATGLKLEQVLESLGGEYGFAITLDESKKISFPSTSPQGLQVPEPGVMLVVKVKNDVIFDRVDKLLQENPMVVRTEKPGLKMRTMNVPLPLPITLKPSLARSGDYLILATTDSLVEEALAVKAGKPGLKSTDEFKKLAQGMPTKGNQFSFMSRRFGETIAQIQTQAAQNAPQADQAVFMKKLMSLYQNQVQAYSVSMNGEDGWISESNGNQDQSKVVLLAPVAVTGMLAAIAVPNFVRARTVAQQNSCMNNLRLIDGAKQQWALENKKKAEDVPTWNDLKPFLGSVPRCPQGGTYTINRMDKPPTCSIPGHSLE